MFISLHSLSISWSLSPCSLTQYPGHTAPLLFFTLARLSRLPGPLWSARLTRGQGETHSLHNQTLRPSSQDSEIFPDGKKYLIQTLLNSKPDLSNILWNLFLPPNLSGESYQIVSILYSGWTLPDFSNYISLNSKGKSISVVYFIIFKRISGERQAARAFVWGIR